MKWTKRQAEAAQEYEEWISAHPTAARDFREAVEDVLVDAGATFDVVSARVKTVHSLVDKMEKKNSSGQYVFSGGLSSAYDLVGVRITTFHSTEIPEIRKICEKTWDIVRVVDKTAQMRISGSFGYGSLHLICSVRPGTLGLAEYAGQVFEIQIRTVLQHAWAEFEHDVRYKNEITDPRVDRAFTLAAGLIELADQQFDQIVGILDGARHEGDDVVLTPQLLPGVLTLLLGSDYPQSKSEYYRWATDMLAAHNITTVGGLRELLTPDRVSAVTAAMHPDYMPGQVRVVDDVLLARFGRDHIKKTVDIGGHARTRSGRLGSRWSQLLDVGMV